ncbi:NUDIX domain-containing protein [Kribbella sp. NPDC003505]|uniref:NUDIX hydrolase n=1 Tax=Kribbella sp. NPDC003505 TaxID=3154448 RepID=UPI0033B554C4
MARLAVKLLLLDEDDRILLIHARDPKTRTDCWYPVGGGVDPGETLQSAAAREAYEETGLRDLPPGTHVWTRDHTYKFNGQTVDVHEEWLLHRVGHFTPTPAELSPYESTTIRGFAWWTADDLHTTTETIYPPELGQLITNASTRT